MEVLLLAVPEFLSHEGEDFLNSRLREFRRLFRFPPTHAALSGLMGTSRSQRWAFLVYSLQHWCRIRVKERRVWAASLGGLVVWLVSNSV